jgi:hypothetical protein
MGGESEVYTALARFITFDGMERPREEQPFVPLALRVCALRWKNFNCRTRRRNLHRSKTKEWEGESVLSSPI